MKKYIISSFIIFLAIQINLFAYGDTFSCNYGKEAACLDYGDKVCSSSSKCVSNDAICFDSYTCNYQGFICKSVYQELVGEYENLVNKYNQLHGEYQETIDKYNSLVSKRNSQMSCLSGASTMDDIQNCLLLY